MKKLMHATVAILTVCFILFGFKYNLENQQGLTGDKVIHFYNWGDYIDPTIIKEFEEETGYRVVYETFDSNEAMIVKLRQGGTAYDITIPSEYMIQTMIKEDMLYPLDYKKLSNSHHIDEHFLNLDFDKDNQYSVPYFWGTLGILYNKTMVNEQAITTWNDLWKPEFKNNILVYDGSRELIGIGLQSEGYSLNEIDDNALQIATKKMKQLMPNIRAIIADEIKMHMAKEEAAIAITFSGEAVSAIEENDNLAYIIPQDGSNIWFDNIVIPKTADNIEGAHALINFLLRPDIAARNAVYIGYATPNKDAYTLLSEDITSDEAFYPNEDMIEKLEAYKSLSSEKKNQFNDLFLEIKIQNK